MTAAILSSAGSSSIVNAVNFDGSNDYLSRGADLTGAADSKIWSGSVWIKKNTTSDITYIYAGDDRCGVFINGDESITLRGKDSAGTEILFGFTSPSVVTVGQWAHIAWMVDLTDTNKRGIFVDGSLASTTWLAYTNDTMDFTRPEHIIGASRTGATKSAFDCAELWISLGEYVDFSSASILAKFRNAITGKPVFSLGADGSLPTGTAPILYFNGGTSAWHTNKGTGGGFTENGTLTTATTSPSQ